MFITLYYVKVWREGVWSGKRVSGLVAHFRTREQCYDFMYKKMPKYTQKERIEPTWINWTIVEKRQYIPQPKAV